MKIVIDELQLRNKTNVALGLDARMVEFRDDFSDCKILLIDDDVVQSKNIKNKLHTITQQLKIIAHSQEIKELDSFVPDLIIINCQVDNEDPLRIIANIRSKSHLKNSFILILAEEENMKVVIKALELGIHDYCTYQVDESEIKARVKTQLRRKQYQDNLRNEIEEKVSLYTNDSLTSVFNRRYFDMHIDQIIETNRSTKKPISLMMIDMDHFKSINDQYGHIAGDEVLKTLTKNLKQAVRATDLIARYGGEEFAILLNNVPIDQAKITAERIRKMIEETLFAIPSKKTPIKCTTSIGLTEYKNAESIFDFIHRADQALYQAKAAGRNVVVVD